MEEGPSLLRYEKATIIIFMGIFTNTKFYIPFLPSPVLWMPLDFESTHCSFNVSVARMKGPMCLRGHLEWKMFSDSLAQRCLYE